MHLAGIVRKNIRRFIPNVWFAGYTYNPIVKVLMRLSDLPARVVYPEFRKLPPNYLRCRVGVSGRFLNNQVVHLTHGTHLWYYLFATGKIGLDSNIVEIGCGCGRRTHHLRDLNVNGMRYTGQYLGVDIDGELLDWCRANFDPARFSFYHSPQRSKAYRNESEDAQLRMPRDDNSVDLVFGTSVLTHLLEPEMKEYFLEAMRILKPGGSLAMTCKCLDLSPESFGNSYKFQMGNAWVQMPKAPEVAVAYYSDFMKQFALEQGFSSVEILAEPGDIQHLLVARK